MCLSFSAALVQQTHTGGRSLRGWTQRFIPKEAKDVSDREEGKFQFLKSNFFEQTFARINKSVLKKTTYCDSKYIS